MLIADIDPKYYLPVDPPASSVWRADCSLAGFLWTDCRLADSQLTAGGDPLPRKLGRQLGCSAVNVVAAAAVVVVIAAVDIFVVVVVV